MRARSEPYLDANVLVALLTPEPLSTRADDFVYNNPEGLIVSNFVAAQFASAIARRVRTRETTVEDARRDLADFDVWVARSTARTDLNASDIVVAATYLRLLDLTLVTPDAMHIAIARRVDAILVTFDRAMAVAAGALGVAVAMP